MKPGNDEDNELVQEFLIECYEGLDQLDQDLLSLENAPRDADLLSAVFRTFHTVKGSAGFLAFHRLEKIAHVAENLLSRLRDGELDLTTGRASALLRTVDVLRGILVSVESTGGEGDDEYTDLVAELESLQSRDEPPSDDETAARREVPGAPAPAVAGSRAEAARDTSVEASVDAVTGAPVDADGVDATDAPVAANGVDAATVPAVAGDGVDAGSPPRGGARTEESTQPSAGPPSPATASKASDSSIRVDVNLLDSLMNLVGELVLTRNQIVQHISSDQATDLNATAQRLSLITSDLQEGVMKTRMQPIRNIWNKYPRVVRDLTQACGKKASIRMEGQETELDRTILEAIKDPLTHMLRNSVDHGVEPCEERRAAGKPEEGRIALRAYHEGGHVNIELSDDGRGIDGERVWRKALERGLLSREKLERLTPREVLQLVFLPGFSTAESVTNVSGRGVGMDVVRTHIEKIGGTVDLQSTPGSGTTIRIKIPLTLAIIPALLVKAHEHCYAIPQVSLIELVRLEGPELQGAIETVRGTPVYRLRGDLLPLVDLRESLGLPRAGEPRDPTINIVVLQANEAQFGLVVDEVWDTEEIVVKPLSHQLREILVFAGATILGDGRVSLILDSSGLAERAGILDGERDGTNGDSLLDDHDANGESQSLLLLELGHKRAAIPLSAVSRLEEIASDRVEVAAERLVTQYRDQIMPLVAITSTGPTVADVGDLPEEPLQVVVHARGDQNVGLVVERIHDIVHERIQIESTTRRPGVQGCAVVQGRVTDLLDVASIIDEALPTRVEGSPHD